MRLLYVVYEIAYYNIGDHSQLALLLASRKRWGCFGGMDCRCWALVRAEHFLGLWGSLCLCPSSHLPAPLRVLRDLFCLVRLREGRAGGTQLSLTQRDRWLRESSSIVRSSGMLASRRAVQVLALSTAMHVLSTCRPRSQAWADIWSSFSRSNSPRACCMGKMLATLGPVLHILLLVVVVLFYYSLSQK